MSIVEKIRKINTKKPLLLFFITVGVFLVLVMAGIAAGIIIYNQQIQISSTTDENYSLQSNIDNSKSQIDELNVQNSDLKQQVQDLQAELDGAESSSASVNVSTPTISQTCGNPFPADITKATPLTKEQEANYNTCVIGWYSKYLPGVTPNKELLFTIN